VKLTLAGIDVDAVSVAGVQTCIQLPGLGLAFDIGRCPLSAISRDTILITHTHMDHVGGIAYHASLRDLRGMRPATYILAPESLEGVEALFLAFTRLSREELPRRLVPLGVGEEHGLPRGVTVRPFRSYHRLPCQGYAIHHRKKKLKPEYAGLPGPEIGRLHREGVAIEEACESLEVAFTGDTTIEVVEREEAVRKARLLIMEVTFLGEKVPVKKARSTGHIHLDEVAERAELFENEAILLTHFSTRHAKEEILEALDKKLPAALRARVTPLIDERGA
jgi:ribonuclease Z